MFRFSLLLIAVSWLVSVCQGQTIQCLDPYDPLCATGNDYSDATRLTCDGYLACSNATYNFELDLRCRASHSCLGVTAENLAYNTINCNAHAACAFATMITGGIRAYSEFSVYKSTLFLTGFTPSYFLGYLSFVESMLYIQSSGAMEFNGYLSGLDSVIHSDSSRVYVHVYGPQSLRNATFMCHKGHECNIECWGGDSCNGLNLVEDGGEFVVQCEADSLQSDICPDGRQLSGFMESVFNLADLYHLVDFSFNELNVLNEILDFDSNKTCEVYCPDDSTCRNNNVSKLASYGAVNMMCCMGYNSCRETWRQVNITDDIIRCDADNSCLGAEITLGANAGNIYVTGQHAAKQAILSTNMQHSIYCLAEFCCEQAEMELADNVYCMTSKACFRTFVQGMVNNVYAYGRETLSYAEVADVANSVHCDGYVACLGTIMNNIGSGGVHALGHQVMRAVTLTNVTGPVAAFGYEAMQYVIARNVYGIYCDGTNCLQNADLQSIVEIKVNGTDALQETHIVSGLAALALDRPFVLEIHDSVPTHFTVECTEGDTCQIACYHSEACGNMGLTCLGTCTVDCGQDGIACPTALNHTSYSYAQLDCRGCTAGGLVAASTGADEQPDCYNLANNSDIFACPGTFENGMNDSSASSLCAQGYHICSSALEAQSLGLLHDTCANVLDEQVYFSLETSLTSSRVGCKSFANTTSSGKIDVWACAGSGVSAWEGAGCALPQKENEVCGPFDAVCGASDLLIDNEMVIDVGEGVDNSWYQISLLDDTYGGILCCIDIEPVTTSSSPPVDEKDNFLEEWDATAAYVVVASFVGACSIALVSIGYWLTMLKGGGDTRNVFSLFLFIYQVVDTWTDLSLCVILWYSKFRSLFFVSTTFLVVPYIMSCIICIRFTLKWQNWSKDHAKRLKDWLHHFDRFLLFATLFGGFYASVDLFQSKLFPHKLWYFPLKKVEVRQLLYYRLVNFVLLENLPQFVVQLLYLQELNANDGVQPIVVFALFTSGVSILFGILRIIKNILVEDICFNPQNMFAYEAHFTTNFTIAYQRGKGPLKWHSFCQNKFKNAIFEAINCSPDRKLWKDNDQLLYEVECYHLDAERTAKQMFVYFEIVLYCTTPDQYLQVVPTMQDNIFGMISASTSMGRQFKAAVAKILKCKSELFVFSFDRESQFELSSRDRMTTSRAQSVSVISLQSRLASRSPTVFGVTSVDPQSDNEMTEHETIPAHGPNPTMSNFSNVSHVSNASNASNAPHGPNGPNGTDSRTDLLATAASGSPFALHVETETPLQGSPFFRGASPPVPTSDRDDEDDVDVEDTPL